MVKMYKKLITFFYKKIQKKYISNVLLNDKNNLDKIVWLAICDIYRRPFMLGVAGIGIAYKENILTIEIVCRRPGLMIGMAGVDIDALTELLSKQFNEPVKVDLTELKRL